MDGTLLDNEGHVSHATREMLGQIAGRGITFSVATARTPATVEVILDGTPTANDLVVMTGAALWDRAKARFKGIRLLPQHDVEMMLKTFRRARLFPFCYVLAEDGTHLNVYHAGKKLNAAEAAFVEIRKDLRLKTFHLGQCCPRESLQNIVLFFAMGGKRAIVEVANKLRKHTRCYVSYYKDTYLPDVWLLEIFAPGVSKAKAIKRLKAQLGAERVVAFGDNLNDIAMLQAADVAVAVDNALPEVKAVADVVIGPNTSDSVARYILEAES